MTLRLNLAGVKDQHRHLRWCQVDGMEKLTSHFEPLSLDRSGKRPLQRQLKDQLKAMIQQGRLRPRDKLPSTRALAEELHVSRNTVVAAYEELQGEGYVEAHERSAYVIGQAAGAFPPQERTSRQETRRLQSPRPLVAPQPFRPAQPDVNLFSTKIWNRHRMRALRHGSNLFQYQTRFALGLDELRQNVGEYLRESRGIHCHWEEIAITGGSQQALFMLGHLLLASGQSAYMEDPGFPGARRAWEQVGARIVPVPVDDEGLYLPLPEADDAALVYTTPSYQFPLGACMSLARRLELLRIARRRGLWIIEDDYDSEFRYVSAPQPSLQSLDDYRRVIYVGSFSKTLVPGLRLGYVVLPPQLVDRFAAFKVALEDHGPLVDQATLAGFLESGAFDSHIRRCRRVYRERQELFLHLAKQKGLPLTFPITGRGMNLAGHFPAGVDDAAQSVELEKAGIDTPPLSSYCTAASLSGLLFGVTAFSEPEIRRGIETMASSLAASFPHKTVAGQGAGAD
jgi:GntR family transcriptional regulator/MocR family aminotransferase